MTEFVTCKYDGVEGTADLPAMAVERGEFPGWKPVPANELPAVRVLEALVTGTVDEVLARVGDDTTRAQVALAAENAATKPRTTLVDALTAIIQES